ncbi:MAG: 50S ribosomal protein L13 [Spirochaetota bacterium]|nr:50S ribosomal protein L13 [Spirochaetota bacterium]
MKTIIPKKEEVKDSWVLVDAKDQVLGRLATKIAMILRGKNSPEFTPHLPGEHGVVVINASEVKVTGRKTSDKLYYHHTGYPGGIRSISFEKVIVKKPDFPIRHAVKGMLPKNRLGRKLLGRLKIYEGAEHPHQAQKPEQV